MTDPMMGEIRPFLGYFAPVGWALCDGSALRIADYELLYELIGDSFGAGDPGTFKLPDLVQRIALGAGSGTGLTPRAVGDMGGSDGTVTDTRHIPPHTHVMMVDTIAPNTASPQGAGLTASPDGYLGYARPQDCTSIVSLATAAVSATPTPDSRSPGTIPGAKYNGMPSFRVNYIISLEGLYPSFPSGSE